MGSDVEWERTACGASAELGSCSGGFDAARVSCVQERLPTVRVTEGMATLFKVLADASRCRLIAAIIEAGEMCVCDLSATIGISESNTSHHLRVLRTHGLVRARRVGRTVYYSPDDAHIRLLLDTTREHVLHRGGGL
jgi:DNA-binding transcriptional ArsR family regulator